MSKVLDILTNVIAWVLKNGNMLVGIVTSIVKLACGLINIFQPGKDDLVDKIQEIGEKIQRGIYKATEILKKFK